MQLTRLFVGIACPILPGIREELQRLRSIARDPTTGVRVVAEENLHITLKFLGSVPDSAIPDIIGIMEAQLGGTGSFTLELRGAGSFSETLWLGVAPEQLLRTLAEALSQALEDAGFPSDGMPYRPHLTLAYLRNGGFDRDVWSQGLAAVRWGTFPVRTIHLYRSNPVPGGVRYTTVHNTTLDTTLDDGVAVSTEWPDPQ